MKEITYEQILECNIYRAIEMKVKENNKEINTHEDILNYYNNSPTRIKNSSLLLDYNYVYENVENILFDFIYEYQRNQGVEQYYTLFKALINKYSLEQDYSRYMWGEINRFSLEYKWRDFALALIKFFSHSHYEILEKLLEREDFISYFLKYPCVYNCDVMESFNARAIGKFLKYDYFYSYYTNNAEDLLYLIKDKIHVTIPQIVMQNNNVIKQIARNYDVEQFYFQLIFVEEQTVVTSYIEEHKKYCDEQIDNAVNGILPCFRSIYENSNELVTLDIKNEFDRYSNSSLIPCTINRIFKNNNLDEIPKLQFFQELSKYIAFNLLVSRNYETSPYNLLIDIETLYEFISENKRFVKGKDIYNFLVNYESKSIFEIIEFYQKVKDLPLMEMLYDDFEGQRKEIIKEINSNIVDINNITPKIDYNIVKYYDITDEDGVLIVHNTGVDINKENDLLKLEERIKSGKKGYICLSIQDKNHTTFYKENECDKTKTIKLVYGKLDQNRVGIIHHTDAYSKGANNVEWENFGYMRRLYTLNQLMAETQFFNEICYVIDGIPFLPIGIICEDEISLEEEKFAKRLNLDIFLRRTNNLNTNIECKHKVIKKSYEIKPNHYGYYK